MRKGNEFKIRIEGPADAIEKIRTGKKLTLSKKGDATGVKVYIESPVFTSLVADNTGDITMRGFEEDPDRRQRQRDPVRERRQHLRAAKTVRARARAGLRCDPLREDREPQRRRVREHVARVGEQREAVRPPPHAGLHQHEERGHHEGRDEPPQRGRA